MSRKYKSIISIFFLCFLLGCSDKSKENNIEQAILAENDSSIAAEKAVSKKEYKDIQTFQEFLTEKEVKDPYMTYMKNKSIYAKTQITSARVNTSTINEDEDVYLIKRLDTVKDYYIKGNFDRARSSAEKLLGYPDVSPKIRAEVYFMLSDMSNKEYAAEESMQYMDRAYQAMKETAELDSVKQKVKNFNELLDYFNELNNIDPSDYEESDTEE